MRGHQVGITHLGTLGGGCALVGCAHPGPPSVVLGSSIFLYLYKKSSQSFVPIWELLFLHKNNTVVVLLKMASIRVSFIQIMQVRVQNKRKIIRKSRYDGDVPCTLPRLCLSPRPTTWHSALSYHRPSPSQWTPITSRKHGICPGS